MRRVARELDMALVGTVKAPKDVVSVTMPPSPGRSSSMPEAWAERSGAQGVKYEIRNLDGTKTVGAKITLVVDPSDLLAKMSSR